MVGLRFESTFVTTWNDLHPDTRLAIFGGAAGGAAGAGLALSTLGIKAIHSGQYGGTAGHRCLVVAGAGRCRAESCVIAKPYTNAVFARTFERHVVEKLPGVLCLRVTPTLSASPGARLRPVPN